MKAFDPATSACNTSVRPWPNMVARHMCVAFRCICGMCSFERVRVDLSFGGVDSARSLESRHCNHIVGVDEPEPRGHWCAVVQQRCVAHDAGVAVRLAYHHGEITLWSATEQLRYAFDVERRR